MPDVEKRTLKAMATVHMLLLIVSSGQANASKIRDDYILAARAVQNLLAATDQLTKGSLQRRDLTAHIANVLQKVLADVSTLEFLLPNAQPDLAVELSAAEQLLDLDSAVDDDHVVAEVRSSSRSEVQQNLLMIHALVARQSVKQLLALKQLANSSQ